MPNTDLRAAAAIARPCALIVALACTVAAVLPAAAGAATLNVVGQWGSAGALAGQFNLPTDLVVAPDSTVYVLENGNDRVQRFEADGKYLGGWGTVGNGPSQFQQPEALTASPAGEISVADAFLSRIQKFSASGSHILTWGILGSGAGQMNSPQGVAAIGDTVYVGDRNNVQIDQYTVGPGATGGTFVRSWGKVGVEPVSQFRLLELDVDASGNVYAVDRDGGRVHKFMPDGTFIQSFGSPGVGAGQLNQPNDVAVDAQGNVWVADYSNFRIIKFAPGGSVLAEYDRAGTGPIRPEAVDVAANGDVYAVEMTPVHRVLRMREPAAPVPPVVVPPAQVPVPPVPAVVPAPVVGVAVNVRVVRGKVLLKLPVGVASASARTSQKGTSFVPLEQARQIPVGSLLDTRRGTVRLTSARDTRGTTQTGDFASGIFQVKQSKKRTAKGLTEIVLKGGSFSGCTRRSPLRLSPGPGCRPPAHPAGDSPSGCQRPRALRHPHPHEHSNRARHQVDHHRALRRHAHQGHPRQRRSAGPPPAEDDRGEGRQELLREGAVAGSSPQSQAPREHRHGRSLRDLCFPQIAVSSDPADASPALRWPPPPAGRGRSRAAADFKSGVPMRVKASERTAGSPRGSMRLALVAVVIAATAILSLPSRRPPPLHTSSGNASRATPPNTTSSTTPTVPTCSSCRTPVDLPAHWASAPTRG